MLLCFFSCQLFSLLVSKVCAVVQSCKLMLNNFPLRAHSKDEGLGRPEGFTEHLEEETARTIREQHLANHQQAEHRGGVGSWACLFL